VMIFSVWAPAARSVELVLTSMRVAMRADGNGYWRIDQRIERSAEISGSEADIDVPPASCDEDRHRPGRTRQFAR
jgi:hypothetical protein